MQFDLCENRGPSASGTPYLLDLQSPVLAELYVVLLLHPVFNKQFGDSFKFFYIVCNNA